MSKSTEIILTSVRLSKKSGESIWLDGAKLHRHGWTKGETLEITKTDSAIVLTRSQTTSTRSTPTTQNLSGRAKQQGETMAILELPIKKTGFEWALGEPLKVQVTNNKIIIRINSYLAERKKRVEKFIKALRSQSATMLSIPVNELPEAPHKNNTEQADLASIEFSEFGQPTSQFYNALMAIEKSNPFAIEVINAHSQSNPLGYGLQAILNNLEYNIISRGNDLYAISNNLDIDEEALDKSMEQMAERLDQKLVDFFAISHVEPMTCQFGALESPVTDRRKRLLEDLDDKRITSASFFHGGGTLEEGFSSVFDHNGIQNDLRLVSEIEDGYLNHSYEVHNALYTNKTLILNGDISAVDFGNTDLKVSSLLSGVPCQGGSRAGKSKNKIAKAEMHKGVGHLFWPVIKALVTLSPFYYTLENTDSYRSTDSFACIKLMLKALGYTFTEAVLDSHNFGSTESRKRLFIMAHSDNESQTAQTFDDFSSKDHHFVGPRIGINHLLDPTVTPDSPMYRTYDHLKAKELRDKAANKNFARNLYTGEETRTLTIRAAYAKAGSSDCYLLNPDNAEESRLFLPTEHARIKGFDASFVERGSSRSISMLHSILGQGIPRPLGAHISKLMLRHAKSFCQMGNQPTFIGQAA